jgi:hypothetical protein
VIACAIERNSTDRTVAITPCTLFSRPRLGERTAIWVRLYTGDDEQNYLWVDETYVQRVESTFKPKGKFKPGFRAEIKDEPAGA